MRYTHRADSTFLDHFNFAQLLLPVPHSLPARPGQLTVTRLRAASQTIPSRLPGATPRFLTRFLPSGRPASHGVSPPQSRENIECKQVSTEPRACCWAKVFLSPRRAPK